jgi:alcohol dehydrogenase class IV
VARWSTWLSFPPDAWREPRIRDVEQSVGTLRAYAPDAILALGGSGGESELWRHLLAQLRQLAEELGLPGGYRECGISEKSYAALLPELVQEALDSGSTRLAPAAPDAASFERMFWRAYHGQSADKG